VRWVVLIYATALGCSYPEFGFNAVDAPANDSAAPPIDTMVAEATSSDTRVEDSIVPPMDAPPKIGCAAAMHDFCVDWEASTEPTYGWSAFYTRGGGTLAVDSTAFTGSRALIAKIPGGSTLNAATVSRTLEAPTSGTITRVDAHVRLDSTSYPSGILLLKLQRDGGHGASIWLGGAGLYAEGFGATYRAYPIAKTLTAGVFHHFRFETTLKPSGALLRVFVDDMKTALVDVADASTCLTEGTSREVIAGLYAEFGTTALPAFTVRYDDVSLDWL